MALSCQLVPLVTSCPSSFFFRLLFVSSHLAFVCLLSQGYTVAHPPAEGVTRPCLEQAWNLAVDVASPAQKEAVRIPTQRSQPNRREEEKRTGGSVAVGDPALIDPATFSVLV